MMEEMMEMMGQGVGWWCLYCFNVRKWPAHAPSPPPPIQQGGRAHSSPKRTLAEVERRKHRNALDITKGTRRWPA